MLCYLIYEVNDAKNYGRGDTQDKTHAVAKASQENYDYCHWDIAENGPIPKQTPHGSYEDNDDFAMPAYGPLRRAGYAMESDGMYQAYRGCVEDGDDEPTAKALWTDVRSAVKTKYPKP